MNLGERLFDRVKRADRLRPRTAKGYCAAPRAFSNKWMPRNGRRPTRETCCGDTLTIGVVPTIAPYLLPDILTEFTEKFPGVEIVVQEDTTARLLKLAHAYGIDLALPSQPIQDERLEVRELFSDELLLALPPGHSLKRKRTVAVAELEAERLVVMKEGHCLGDQVLRFCERIPGNGFPTIRQSPAWSSKVASTRPSKPTPNSSATTTWSWPGAGAVCGGPECRFDAANPLCWNEIHCWRPPGPHEAPAVCRC